MARLHFICGTGLHVARNNPVLQGTTDFTLTLANVEWVSEEDSFLYLRCNTNVTIRGPVNFDADPFRVSQCEVVDTDGETYLDLQVEFCLLLIENNSDGCFCEITPLCWAGNVPLGNVTLYQ